MTSTEPKPSTSSSAVLEEKGEPPVATETPAETGEEKQEAQTGEKSWGTFFGLWCRL